MSIIDEANKYAAKNAVEYLQEINEYDLRKLGEKRFKTLIELINRNYHLKLNELEGWKLDDDDIPF